MRWLGYGIGVLLALAGIGMLAHVVASVLDPLMPLIVVAVVILGLIAVAVARR